MNVPLSKPVKANGPLVVLALNENANDAAVVEPDVSSTVCEPAANVDGIVTVSVTLPFASAATFPRSTGVECKLAS